jgi:hypothetical protein
LKNSILALSLTLSLFGEGEPDWLKRGGGNNPQLIYGIGSSPKQSSTAMQIRFANIFARANLSQNIKTYIDSNLSTSSSTISENDFQLTSIQRSKTNLKVISIQDRWSDENGELYILIAIDKKEIN